MKRSFTIAQLLSIMLVFCVIAAAVGYLVSGRVGASPLVFQLMLLAAPLLLVVVVSVMLRFTRRR